MGQFDTREVGLFITHLYRQDLKKEQDDYLFAVWLVKVWEPIDYPKWKEKVLKNNNKSTTKKKMTDEEAEKNVNKANRILNIKGVD